jgi:hypothetical protein
MADLFEGYRDTRVLAGSPAPFDEMFSGAKSPRAPYGMVHEALSQMFLRFEGFMTIQRHQTTTSGWN